MGSPFPGMDPYLEASGLWADFHDDLVSEIKRALAQAAPSRYLVRTGERSYVVLVASDGKDSYPFLPDVSVTTPRRRRKNAPQESTAVLDASSDAEPLTMRAFIEEEHRESFVEIYEATPQQRLVTCIEVLSPSNKRPGTEGWHQYTRKRQSLILGGVNLVELDLLRGGQRMPMLDPWPESPYRLLVARGKKSQLCKVWLAGFQQPLPPIPVPLTKPDPDLPLLLQPMIEAIYQRSRYEQSIDYRKPLDPPLAAEEAAWLAQRLGSRS